MLAVSTEPVYYHATILVGLVARSVCARSCGCDYLRYPGRALTGVLWESYPCNWRPPAILCGPYWLWESYPYIPGASDMGGVTSWRNASQDVMPSICVSNLTSDQRSYIALWNVTLIPTWIRVIITPNMNWRVPDYEIKATYFCILSKQYRQRRIEFCTGSFRSKLEHGILF